LLPRAAEGHTVPTPVTVATVGRMAIVAPRVEVVAAVAVRTEGAAEEATSTNTNNQFHNSHTPGSRVLE